MVMKLFFLLLALLSDFSASQVEDDSDLAPLFGMDLPTRIFGLYMVGFRPNHSIDEHWHNIKADLSGNPDFRNWPLFRGYHAEMVGTTPCSSQMPRTTGRHTIWRAMSKTNSLPGAVVSYIVSSKLLDRLMTIAE